MQTTFRRFLISLCFSLFLGASLFAQQDLGIHFMQGVWQSSFTNPAFKPDKKVVLMLPGFYNQLRLDNFTYNDLIRTNAQGANIVDLDNVIDKMGSQNIIRNQTDVHTFAMSIKINKFFLQLGHDFHLNAYLNYPKELAELVWNGNAQFIGQEVSFGPDVALQGYNNFYLGGSGEIAPGIRVGGRFKVLLGIVDLSTQSRNISLSTSDDIYQSTIQADYILNSTGGVTYNGINGETEFDFNDGKFDLKDVFSSNYGIGIDLGVQASFDKWSFAASAIDLGAITWRDDPSNLKLQGDFEYEGLDVVKDALLGEVSVGALGDSLEAAFDVIETNRIYTTSLPNKFYLSSTYNLDRTWSFGALIYLENYREKVHSTFGLSAQGKVSNFLDFGAMYSFNEDEPFRLGFNLGLRGGPFQLVLATDNLITAFQFEESNTANFRFGLNIVAGQIRKKKKPKDVVDPNEFFR